MTLVDVIRLNWKIRRAYWSKDRYLTNDGTVLLLNGIAYTLLNEDILAHDWEQAGMSLSKALERVKKGDRIKRVNWTSSWNGIVAVSLTLEDLEAQDWVIV